MSTPREEEAQKYLQNHKILQLMDNLTSMLFYYRPEQPKEFLISQLEKIQASKLQATDSPCLFDDSNVDAVWGLLDPTNQGYISYSHCREALKMLGIQHFSEGPEDLGNDRTNDRISYEAFKQEAKECLLKNAATFQI